MAPIDDPEDWLDRVAESDLAEFTVGPREVLCPTCFTIHRPETGCD